MPFHRFSQNTENTSSAAASLRRMAERYPEICGPYARSASAAAAECRPLTSSCAMRCSALGAMTSTITFLDLREIRLLPPSKKCCHTTGGSCFYPFERRGGPRTSHSEEKKMATAFDVLQNVNFGAQTAANAATH